MAGDRDPGEFPRRDDPPGSPLARAAARATHAIFGGLLGAVFGLGITLAIVILNARAGRYIFALHDLASVRWETLPVPIVAGAAAWMAARRPASYWHAVLLALAGLVGGALAGAFIGSVFGATPEWQWTAGVLGSVVGGLVLGLRRLRPGMLANVPCPEPPAGARAIWTAAIVLVLFGAMLGALRVPGVSEDMTAVHRIPDGAPALPADPGAVESVTFLVGDGGETVAGRTPILEALRHDIERWSAALLEDSAVSVMFLGDLVYPVGVRDRTHGEYARDSARLWNQVDLLGGPRAREHDARGLFLAGNHDWGNTSGAAGLDRILNLNRELERARALGIAATLEPPHGTAGPAVRDVGRHLRLVMLDTHWFLQNRSRRETGAFISRIDSTMRTAGDRHVVFAAHHPYQSVGPHGAVLPTYYAWGVGLLLKRTGTLVQDLNSRVYAGLLRRMRDVFAAADAPPLVFAGGHDHSLQVMSGEAPMDPSHVLVSGAASKVSEIANLPALEFGAVRPGYMMLVTRRDGSMQLYVVAGDPERMSCPETDPERTGCMVAGENRFDVVYSKELTRSGEEATAAATRRAVPWRTLGSTEALSDLDDEQDVRAAPPVAVPMRVLLFDPDSVWTTPGREYDVGVVERTVKGELNRRLWATPVHLPVIDLDTLGGGVRATGLSGGLQTMGVRLEGENAVTYQFRAIVKTATAIVPDPLDETQIGRAIDDLMAAQFPFSAVVVAGLLEAAGAHVARPVPVVLPNSERLGDYRPLLAGRVGWLEVWPNERQGGRPGFAGSSKIVDGETIFERLDEDPRGYVDARAFLRVRLLDILVGDWDRHPDQWRWASFADGDRTRWEPISRDRDWALNRDDGFAGALSGLFLPRYVSFDESYPPVERLIRTGAALDERFLAELSLAEFTAEARSLMDALPDSVLRRAVRALPPTHHELAGPWLMDALRARRDGLVDIARDFHADLARRSPHAEPAATRTG